MIMDDLILKKDVVCFVPEERTKNYKWDKKYREDNFINIELVSIDKVKKNLDEFCRINGIAKSLIKQGAVLARHPYRPNTYMDFNTSTFDLLNSKFDAISHIAMLLGAKRMKVKVKIKNKKKIIIDAKGNVNYSGFSFGGIFHSSKEIKESKEFNKTEEYEGCLTPDSYNEAVKQSKQYAIQEEIENLLNKRNPSYSNILKKQDVEIKATKEYDSLLNSCAKLSSLAEGLELDAEFRRKVSERFDAYFISTIEF